MGWHADAALVVLSVRRASQNFLHGPELLRHGHGTYGAGDGTSYFGEWVDDYYGGRGAWHDARGASYDGEFVGGQRHGRGLWIAANGDRHAHNLTPHPPTPSCRPTATGTLRDRTSAALCRNAAPWAGCRYRYEGDFVGGAFHGYGVHASTKGNRVYQGEWLKGKRHGEGTFSCGQARRRP